MSQDCHYDRARFFYLLLPAVAIFILALLNHAVSIFIYLFFFRFFFYTNMILHSLIIIKLWEELFCSSEQLKLVMICQTNNKRRFIIILKPITLHYMSISFPEIFSMILLHHILFALQFSSSEVHLLVAVILRAKFIH